MKINIELCNKHYLINTDFSHSAAINLTFNDTQPQHFGAQVASAKPMQVDGFIGDTLQGGSCNVNEIYFNPHCNGTHTETIRHICDQSAELALSIANIELPPLLPCVLLTITPELASQCQDSYTPEFADNDQVITKQAIQAQLANYSSAQTQALAIRTFPNTKTKLSQSYTNEQQAAFFTREAILYLNELGVEHLLVDIPSLDRLDDDGLLTCHHLFWQVPEGSHQPTINSLTRKTITELCFFDNSVSDGFYFLNLQLPAFNNDAAPSRPMLYNAQCLSD